VGELFLAPHPSGEGLIERSPTAVSDGLDSAGAVIGANDAGDLDDSWLPFSRAPEIDDAEIESAAVPVQAVDGGGRAWRWFGLARLAAWLELKMLNAVCPVGTMRTAMLAEDTDYWLRTDGRTLGNEVSGAALSGPRYEDLFKVLWNAVSGQYALTVTNADGAVVVRGATAQQDWNAGRRIVLPNPGGRLLLAAGGGAGLSTRTVGMFGGAEQAAIAVDHMPSHRHSFMGAKLTGSETTQLVTDVKVDTLGTSVSSTASSTLTASPQIIIQPAELPSHGHTATATVNAASIEAHTHGVTMQAVGMPSHGHNASGSFLTEAAKEVAVAVTVDEESAGALTIDEQEYALDPHAHTASGVFTTDAARTQNVNVNVGAVSGGNTHDHTASTVAQLPSSGHLHTATVKVNSSGGIEHNHDAYMNLNGSVSTSVTSTPTIKLQLTKASRTISAVGEESTSTDYVGHGVPLSIMPPYMTFAVMIRY
jgi:microcystin-dependent protein